MYAQDFSVNAYCDAVSRVNMRRRALAQVQSYIPTVALYALGTNITCVVSKQLGLLNGKVGVSIMHRK